MTKRLYSIQHTLLLHELSFVLLVIVTAAVAIIWSNSWQKSSEESLRITSMYSSTQKIRGEVYRQLKEVFDASFLGDSDAVDEYQGFTRTIHGYIDELSLQANNEQEHEAVTEVLTAYSEFYQQTVIIFQNEELNSAQRESLDSGLENNGFVSLESSFANLEQLLAYKQHQLMASRTLWSTRLIWLAFIPVLLAIYLLIVTRRFVKANVLRPLANVIKGAGLISKGDLEHSLPVTGVEELVHLALAINVMANELAANRDSLIETKKQAALGELVPLVAHNIRNPLAGIRAAAQVACDDDIDTATRETLTDIIIAVDRLERWVTSLLRYLHPIQPHLVLTSLITVVDNALSLTELQLADKGMKLARTGWDTDVGVVNIDIHLFEQVIFNLVQNALEASSAGDTITLDYRENNNEVILTISDQGHGMSFSPLEQQGKDEDEAKLNCGLGIPFALKVIQQHGAELNYQSSDDEGTVVTIKLATVESTDK
mgnify:CR=1 FL=1